MQLSSRVPHAGAGTTKAALDAASLADCMRDAGGDLPPGLKNYERTQLPFGSAMVELNRARKALICPPSSSRKPSAPPANCDRDIGQVLHAHIARSEQVGAIVAGHGLTGLY